MYKTVEVCFFNGKRFHCFTWFVFPWGKLLLMFLFLRWEIPNLCSVPRPAPLLLLPEFGQLLRHETCRPELLLLLPLRHLLTFPGAHGTQGAHTSKKSDLESCWKPLSFDVPLTKSLKLMFFHAVSCYLYVSFCHVKEIKHLPGYQKNDQHVEYASLCMSQCWNKMK